MKNIFKKMYIKTAMRQLNSNNAQFNNMVNENCIMVDVHDNILGSISKMNCHMAKSNKLHRAFSLFLFDENNKMLLQQRSYEKITFPGMYSNTICSHPLYNFNESEGIEGVKKAAIRRLNDELGIQEIETQDLIFVTRIIYSAVSCDNWCENELDYVLLCKKNVSIHPNLNEVSGFEFVDDSRLKEMIERKKYTFSPWFKLLLEQEHIKNWWNYILTNNMKTIKQHQEKIFNYY
ncbi:hypothetical protein A3Q56_02802 [Intoshia linei]|uniref:isopentenyl-diphosphate Delta-isomerase n=1 Tax=Intoshia linei TaxID=1819745 RepID=A0A177B5P4_9BILA|nr:hypothetical protein A3Q56_02802 [Intoshia linei]